MNKKGFASSTIIYGLLSIFLIAISILICTMNSNVRLNKSLNEKTVENIEYGTSSINDIEQRLIELENKILTIDEIYPVGSIYMSTTDDTVEKVQERFGGTWEKYSEGRTLVGEGTTTDANGNALTYTTNETGGSSLTELSVSNLPSHSHVIPSLSVSSWSGSHKHSPSIGGYFFIMGGSSGETTEGYTGGAAFEQTNKARNSTTNSVTIKVSGQKTTESNTTTCTNCNASSFSIQNPYIVTYMYKRVG